MSTFPDGSAATQSDSLGHVTSDRPLQGASTCVTDRAAPGVVAAVEVTALPSPSTATRSVADGHVTASIGAVRESIASEPPSPGPATDGVVVA